VAAGAPAVQLRDKSCGARALAEQARALAPIVQGSGALLFVNDRLDVALAVAADGVHLGPDDLPVAAARRVAPPRFLIGASTDDPGEARRLIAAGADYIGCGTVYTTSSKSDAGSAIGLAGLRRVVDAVQAPVVGIGGVTPARAADVATTGAAGIAAIGALMGARDVGDAVRAFLEPWSV
jgi:thiamine-phosphate pyrophosphorylase